MALAWAIGIVSLGLFAWFVTVGRGDFTQNRVFSDVFDLQARAILQGRLSVPDGSLAFEGFVIDGQTYAYFGIFPSLIRLPVLVLTDRFDGELTAVSMLVAYVVAVWAVVRVVERSRRLLRPDAPWTGTGLLAAGLLLAVAAAGSNLMFLASGAWVYHEAALWGAAGVLASFAATLRFLERPRLRTVVAAGVWAMVAWTSRGSVGLAPSIVLGLLGLAHLSGHRWLMALVPPPARSEEAATAPTAEPAEVSGATRSAAPNRGAAASTWPRDWRLGAGLLLAAAAGAVVFGAVNMAKFGSPSALPFDKQVASASPWPTRRAALEAYDGTLFSIRLVPSVAAQTFRPDLVGPAPTWPFVRFRDVQPPVWDGLVFDTVEPSAGLTVTSPFLLALAGIGAVAVIRRAPRRSGEAPEAGDRSPLAASVLRPFLLGGVAAAYPPFTIAFIAQRYLTDALPLLIVAGAAGAVVLDDRAGRRRAADRRGRRIAVGGALATLAVVSVVMTIVVTWSFQRFVSPPDRAALAAGVRTQVAVATVVGSPPGFTRYDELPDRAPAPGLAVRGECLGVYRGNALGGWDAVEVSARGGVHRLSFRLPARIGPRPQAMLTVGDEADHLAVGVVGDRSSARLQLFRNGRPGPRSARLELGGGEHEMEVQADPTFAYVRALVDDSSVLLELSGAPEETAAIAGDDPFGDLGGFTGTVTIEPTPVPTCNRLLAGG